MEKRGSNREFDDREHHHQPLYSENGKNVSRDKDRKLLDIYDLPDVPNPKRQKTDIKLPREKTLTTLNLADIKTEYKDIYVNETPPIPTTNFQPFRQPTPSAISPSQPLLPTLNPHMHQLHQQQQPQFGLTREQLAKFATQDYTEGSTRRGTLQLCV